VVSQTSGSGVGGAVIRPSQRLAALRGEVLAGIVLGGGREVGKVRGAGWVSAVGVVGAVGCPCLVGEVPGERMRVRF
jgi:hypothetical protein